MPSLLAGTVAFLTSPSHRDHNSIETAQVLAVAPSTPAPPAATAAPIEQSLMNADQKIVPVNPVPAPPAEPQPAQLVGRWLLDGSIRREAEIKPDGTATMNVKLDYVSSFLYGKEMNLELSWKLENGMLTHSILGGTPVDNVKRLTRDFGDTRSYKLVSVDDKEMVLQSAKSGEVYRWVAEK